MNLSVYIIEDDLSACARFKDTAEHMDDITIEGFTDDATTAHKYIIENNPDAIILDLELNIGNGVELIEKINKLPEHKRPFIVVTTNTSNPITIDYMHQNNSGFIFTKYKPDYSEYNVLNFLRLIKVSIYNYRNAVNTGKNINKENIESYILSDIDKELIRVGISEKVKGYDYLKSAIFYVIKNTYDNKMLTELANQYNCKPQLIESNMRYAISSAWNKYKSVNELSKVYSGHISPDMNPPSSGKFISHYANILKNKHLIDLEKL